MVSPQYLRYAAGSEKEKGAGGRLHRGTIAHSFVFAMGGWRRLRTPGSAGEGDGWFCLGVRPPSAERSGLACAVVPPAHPPTFLGTGGLPLYPRRGLRPLHPAWGTEGRFLTCR